VFIITGCVHYVGGLANVFGPFLYFIVIIEASILLTLYTGIIIASLSSILYALIIGLEYFEVIPRISMVGLEENIYENGIYVMLSVGAKIYLFFGSALLSGYLANISKDKSRELAIANKKKSEFIAIASHEIKAPLTAIREGISAVLNEIMGKINEKQRKLLTIAKINIDRLFHLIINLLDLSKIESHTVTISQKFTDIEKLAKKVVSSLSLQTEAKNIVIENTLHNLPKVYIDPERISQVFVNLLTNAINFTPDSGKITIEGKLKEDFIEISITDTGIGIAKENLNKIFDKFYQVEKTKGTGLGLTISKNIIELHGGKIWAESTIGKGSKFTFSIPIYPKKEKGK
jgi:signal transduction histidine kinase